MFLLPDLLVSFPHPSADDRRWIALGCIQEYGLVWRQRLKQIVVLDLRLDGHEVQIEGRHFEKSSATPLASMVLAHRMRITPFERLWLTTTMRES